MKIFLKELNEGDEGFFSKWWRDVELIALTSGDFEPISDIEVNEYFKGMLSDSDSMNYMIIADDVTIGHVSVSQRRDNWSEIQIVIGEKEYWGSGYGTKAIKLAIDKAKKRGVKNIYLEVRPTNIGAIKAYENCGFEKAGTVKYNDNSNLPETLRMELRH